MQRSFITLGLQPRSLTSNGRTLTEHAIGQARLSAPHVLGVQWVHEPRTGYAPSSPRRLNRSLTNNGLRRKLFTTRTNGTIFR
jgi:hypothetical protein